MKLGEMMEAIKERNERLAKLLAEPEPGLATWVSAVGKALDDVAEFAPNYVREKR